MASDRSRFSFDRAQQYRSVVIQQGKVLTDSDLDEAQDILAEELRQETIDVVGAFGTPDDGYKISIPSPATNFDFGIGAGTMYVGGLRVSIPGDPAAKTPPFSYAKQPEWLTPTPSGITGAAKEWVWLELIEHDVSSLEDRALLEPAFGGPDTAARRRLLQRIRRSSTTASTCSDAKNAQAAAWANEGRKLGENGRLQSFARLQVSAVATTTTPNPCDPIAHGGYLGAENQLIRVRTTGQSTFVWAFDDASALYRINEVRGGNQLITVNVPVDDAHRPKASQVVELLPVTAKLANGEVITEPAGAIFTQTADYNADDRALSVAKLPTGLTADNDHPLFARIWESELAFTAGKGVELPGTGLQVTLTLDGGSAFADGEFWTFAVRPQAPADVYPARYAQAPQPAEGPRRWACGLAVLNWTSATAGSVADDCRLPFDDLVELTARKQQQNACCSVTISPADVVNGSLQDVVDRAKKTPDFKICLQPGVYTLTDPIVLTSDHTSVSFEACRGGAVLTGNAAKLKDGLVQITGANDVAFRGIQFRLPPVDIGERGADRAKVGVAIGIRMFDGSLLDVEQCDFLFVDDANVTATLGAGVLANGRTAGLSVRDSTFAALGTRFGDVTARVAVAPLRVKYVGVAAVPGFFADAIPAPAPAPGPNFNVNIARVIEATPDVTRFAAAPLAGGVTPAAAAPAPSAPATAKAQTPAASTPAAAAAAVTLPVDRPQPGPVGPIPPVETVPPPIGTIPPVVAPLPGTNTPVTAPVTARGSMLPATVNGVEISGNRFASCHTAALFCGDISGVDFHDNDVDALQNGLVIIAGRWIPAVTFLTRARLDRIFALLNAALADEDKAQRWNAVQAAAELVGTFAHPENATFLSAIASVDLPDAQKTNPSLFQLTAGLDENGWVDPLSTAATSAFTSGASALDLFGVARQGVTAEVQRRVTSLWATQNPSSLFVNQVAAGLGFGSLLQRGSAAVLTLQCSGNTVRARGGTSIYVQDDTAVVTAFATITGNGFHNNSLILPAAVAAFISRCDVNGNLVQNETQFNWNSDSNELLLFWSMIVIPGTRPPDQVPVTANNRRWLPPLVAIMGNVFKGWPVLPPRPMPEVVRDPFDTWLFLNTVSW